jgi:hypothetical protein
MASDKPLVLHDCAFDGLPLQMDVKTLVGIQVSRTSVCIAAARQFVSLLNARFPHLLLLKSRI